MAGLTASDVQPRGNAAAQEKLSTNGCPEWAESICQSADELWAWAFGDEHSEWWSTYKSSTSGEPRQLMVFEAWQDTALQGHIDALSPDQTVDPSQFREELGEVLDYYQHLELMRASGMSWPDLAAAQRGWMTDISRSQAEADNGGVAVTDSQVQEAHAEQVGTQGYYSNTASEDTEWSRMTADEQAEWRARARSAIVLFIEWAHREHPGLRLSSGEIKPALKLCEELNAVAFVEDGICHISREVVVAIERDPAYALSTIQHELRGHPEFGSGFSVGMALYDDASAEMPGYSRPAEGSASRTAEWARYDYLESEVGALLREHAFWVDSRDLDRDETIGPTEINPLGNPIVLLEALLGDMQGNWEPKILQAHLTALLRRFQSDPRIADSACVAFSDACVRTLGLTP